MRTLGTLDPIGVALAGLTPLSPNRSHAEAVRRRCRTQLARRAVGSRRADAADRSCTAVAVPVLLGLFSALYAALLLTTTLRIEGWLP
jgi:hypothetical protein